MTAVFIRKVLLLSSTILPIIVFSQPVINSFSPVSAYAGSSVTISGTGFNPTPANNIVFFGSVKAVVLAATNSQLTVKMPVGASYQPISVATGSLVGYSGQYFTPSFNNNGHADFTRDSFKDTGVLVSSADGSSQDMGSADLDGDGKVDLITLDKLSDKFSVYRNTATLDGVSFANAVVYNTGSNPQYMSVTDMDGDGKLDLTIVNYNDSTLVVYKNNSLPGNLSFTVAATVQLAIYPAGLAVADFDGDGKQDVAVPQGGPKPIISIYKNVGTNNTVAFSSPSNMVAESVVTGIVASDFNNDGKQDFVVSYLYLSSVGVYRNASTTSGFSFVKGAKFLVNNTPARFKVADLEGNGKMI